MGITIATPDGTAQSAGRRFRLSQRPSKAHSIIGLVSMLTIATFITLLVAPGDLWIYALLPVCTRAEEDSKVLQPRNVTKEQIFLGPAPPDSVGSWLSAASTVARHRILSNIGSTGQFAKTAKKGIVVASPSADPDCESRFSCCSERRPAR